MMGKDKVSPGQPLSSSPLRRAGVVNHLLDSANFVRDNRDAILRSLPLQGVSRLVTDCVKVRNDTGANRSRGECVQLGAYLPTTLEADALFFAGETPADPIHLRYAILREPLLYSATATDRGIGLAQASGVCVASVNVQDVDHRFCTPEASSNVLKTGFGPIELLQIPTGTGTQELCVRLSSPPTFCIGKIASGSSLAVGGNCTVDVWAWNGSAYADTGLDITAYDWLMKSGATTIGSGRKVACYFFVGRWFVIQAECP